MFILYADKNKLTVRKREAMTSGSANVYEVRFEFSPDWDGLKKTAVFESGEVSKSWLLDDTGLCTIPPEVVAVPGRQLTAGVYGTLDGRIVLPTIRANMGIILEGIPAPDGEIPPTPDLWEQALAGKADGLDYDGLNLSLLSGEKALSSVQIAGGGGGQGGTTDHRQLTHRDAVEQHPIEAISGLEEISNLKVLEIWNGGKNK